MQNRFKSKVTWVSIASLLLLFLNQLNILGLEQMEALKSLIDSVLCLLVTFGILNNPCSKGKF